LRYYVHIYRHGKRDAEIVKDIKRHAYKTSLPKGLEGVAHKATPPVFALTAYPNPFNPSTQIRFTMTGRSHYGFSYSAIKQFRTIPAVFKLSAAAFLQIGLGN
jgi:hypothetical protein